MVISTSPQRCNCAFYQTGWVRGLKLCQLFSFSPLLHFSYTLPILFLPTASPLPGSHMQCGAKCFLVLLFHIPTILNAVITRCCSLIHLLRLTHPLLWQPFLFFVSVFICDMSWFISIRFHFFTTSLCPVFFFQSSSPTSLHAFSILSHLKACKALNKSSIYT